jgi:hypothetical protein
VAFRKAHGKKPLYYRNRDRWTPIPKKGPW